MEKIAILFPGDEALKEPLSEFSKEFDACGMLGRFDCVLYRRQDAGERKGIAVSKNGTAKSQYCIVRGLDDAILDRDILQHALKRCGYRPVFYDSWFCDHEIDGYLEYQPELEGYIPKRIRPYNRFIGCDSKSPRWSPACIFDDHKAPLVAKNNNSVVRNDDGSIRRIAGRLDDEEIDSIILSFSSKNADFYTGTFRSAPMLFEEYLDIAKVDGTKVEWRAFSCFGKIFYISPKFLAKGNRELPYPPENLLQVLESNDFLATDIALTVDKGWKITRRVRGEIARVPPGGNAERFYIRLHAALVLGPSIPEWLWCPVAHIVEEHAIGQAHVNVEGSRHFSAGTKVYMTNAYWGQGAERCTVLGIPKYSKDLVGVVVDTGLLGNFKLEKVTDKDVIRAMWTNRLQERYERPRKTKLRTCWGQLDEDKNSILGFVDSVERCRAKDGSDA